MMFLSKKFLSLLPAKYTEGKNITFFACCMHFLILLQIQHCANYFDASMIGAIPFWWYCVHGIQFGWTCWRECLEVIFYFTVRSLLWICVCVCFYTLLEPNICYCGRNEQCTVFPGNYIMWRVLALLCMLWTVQPLLFLLYEK